MAAMFALEWESKRSYLRRLRNVVTGLAQSNHKLAKDRMRARGRMTKFCQAGKILGYETPIFDLSFPP